MSDYLWDRSGKPDPEVAALEDALSELRFDRPMPPIPAKRRPWWLLAAAALVVVVIGFIWSGREEAVRVASELPVPSAVPAVGDGWKVARASGTPTCNGDPVYASDRLDVGGWLVTDDRSTAIVDVADIGKVEVAPRSRLRLVETGRGGHRMELARGSIHAQVDAPPRVFVVDTPSAKAVDLGCEYTLEVAEDGGSILEVTSGWVALEGKGTTAYLPVGTRCHTHPGGRVSIPYANDAPAEVIDALRRLEEGASSDQLLKVARRADYVSLWHVLWRIDARKPIYQRMLANGARRPTDEAGVLRGDAAALLDWGEGLGIVPLREASQPQKKKAPAPPVWE